MVVEAWFRLNPIWKATASVALVLLLINACLVVLDRIDARWLPVVVAGGGFVETSHSKVFAGKQDLLESDPSQFRVVAVLGLSGARECLSIKRLEEADGIDARYLALCGAGGAMDAIDDLASPLFEYELVPDLVLIGVSPHLLVEPPPPSEAVRSDGSPSSRGTQTSNNLRQTIKELIWIRSRRADVAGLWAEETSRLRRGFLRTMGVPIRSDGVEPWGELWHADWPERATRATIDGMLSGYGQRGCYLPERYREEGGLEQAASLRSLIQRLVDRGSRVLVFLVPEASELRSRIPPEGVQALIEAIPTEPVSQIELLDHRETLEDWEFVEISHANHYGKVRFSELMAGEIRRILDGETD